MKKQSWLMIAGMATCVYVLSPQAQDNGDDAASMAGLVSFGAEAAAPVSDGDMSGDFVSPSQNASPMSNDGGGNSTALAGEVASLNQLKSSLTQMRLDDPNGVLSPDQIQMAKEILQTAQNEVSGTSPSPEAQAADALLSEIQDMVGGEQACANNAQSPECGEYRTYISNERAMGGGWSGSARAPVGQSGPNALSANAQHYASCGVFHRKNCVNKSGQIIGPNGKVIGNANTTSTTTTPPKKYPSCGLFHKTNCMNKSGQLVGPSTPATPTHTTSNPTTTSCSAFNFACKAKQKKAQQASGTGVTPTTTTTSTASSSGTHWWNKKPSTTSATKATPTAPAVTKTPAASSSGTHWWSKKPAPTPVQHAPVVTHTAPVQHTAPAVTHPAPAKTTHSVFGSLFHKSTPTTSTTTGTTS